MTTGARKVALVGAAEKCPDELVELLEHPVPGPLEEAALVAELGPGEDAVGRLPDLGGIATRDRQRRRV